MIVLNAWTSEPMLNDAFISNSLYERSADAATVTFGGGSGGHPGPCLVLGSSKTAGIGPAAKFFPDRARARLPDPSSFDRSHVPHRRGVDRVSAKISSAGCGDDRPSIVNPDPRRPFTAVTFPRRWGG